MPKKQGYSTRTNVKRLTGPLHLPGRYVELATFSELTFANA
ncbi:MAG: hypothetical protein R3C49_04055 [Planctomycetaceae bacterium]